jgi:dipeptidyl-peptidase-4
VGKIRIFTYYSLHRRGIAFEGAIHRDMGNLEVQDQNCAVAYFAGRGLIDPTRVGE